MVGVNGGGHADYVVCVIRNCCFESRLDDDDDWL